MLLELNPAAGRIVSAEIGVDFINVVRTDFAAQIMWQHKESHTGKSQQEIIDRTLALLHQAVDEAGSYLLGMAVGVPGLVDSTSGHLLFAPNLDWRDLPLGKLLHESFDGDFPIFVDNEANLAALGEYYFGAAQGINEVLYISVGVGLGGGIVRNGVLFRGKTGFAGEFGHMVLDPHSTVACNCGSYGCWETLVSQSTVFRTLADRVAAGEATLLTELTGGDLSRLNIPLVVEAAGSGDALTCRVLNEVGHNLGLGVASLVNALDPDLVVMGGILSLAAEYLLPAVEREMAERALSHQSDITRIILARHGFDACVMGGVATVFQAILAQPGRLARQTVG
jgi:glucokinase-like ROK family protein